MFVDANGTLWMVKRLRTKATSDMTGAQYEQIGHIDSTKQRVNYRPGQAVYNEPSFGLPCTLNHIELLGASGYHIESHRDSACANFLRQECREDSAIPR